jgi:hypothetical protein
MSEVPLYLAYKKMHPPHKKTHPPRGVGIHLRLVSGSYTEGGGVLHPPGPFTPPHKEDCFSGSTRRGGACCASPGPFTPPHKKDWFSGPTRNRPPAGLLRTCPWWARVRRGDANSWSVGIPCFEGRGGACCGRPPAPPPPPPPPPPWQEPHSGGECGFRLLLHLPRELHLPRHFLLLRHWAESRFHLFFFFSSSVFSCVWFRA